MRTEFPLEIDLKPFQYANAFQLDWPQTDSTPRRIFLSVPPTEPPSTGFPVVYILDGNAFFPSTVAQANMLSGHPESAWQDAIILGLGYPIESSHDIVRRWFDLTPETPTPPDVPLRHMMNSQAIRYGGAEFLHEFIEQSLKPWLYDHYAIDRTQQTLVGHSLGGLFTLYTLLRHPESYANYLAVSPSLWWNDKFLLEQIKEELVAPSKAQQRAWQHKGLFLAVGGQEKDFMYPDALQAMECFQPHVALASVEQIPHTHHGTVAQPAITAGLNVFLAKN